jgi:hypothetical protein
MKTIEELTAENARLRALVAELATDLENEINTPISPALLKYPGIHLRIPQLYPANRLGGQNPMSTKPIVDYKAHADQLYVSLVRAADLLEVEIKKRHTVEEYNEMEVVRKANKLLRSYVADVRNSGGEAP